MATKRKRPTRMRTVVRSALSGRFVKKSRAKSSPTTTFTQRFKVRPRRKKKKK